MMTLFIRLLDVEKEKKAEAMAEAITAFREGRDHPRVFEVDPESFAQVPGTPFAYWVSEEIRELFKEFPTFEDEGRTVKQGLATADDFRFVRMWLESTEEHNRDRFPLAKGGAYSPFYADVYLTVNWEGKGAEIAAFDKAFIRNRTSFFRPGMTWPRRTNGLSFRIMPGGCIFADKGPAAFVSDDDPERLLALLAVLNSAPFKYLVGVQLARTELAQSYEVGLIQRTPLPEIPDATHQELAAKARRAWSIQRELDTTNETSHAFVLPALLRARLCDWDPDALKAELRQIQGEIDAIAFDLYGFSPADRVAASRMHQASPAGAADEDEELSSK